MAKRLGLPLEYKKLPEYFDAHNINDETASKNAVLESLLKRYGVKTVLDMTCGTGSQVFYLQSRGYDVVGSDFSPALLDIARARALREGCSVRFIDGDMRTLKVGSFDAVITMFNAVGHLTRAGFLRAMRNVRRNLSVGGIYVFDIFNASAMTEATVKSLAMEGRRTGHDAMIHNVQHSTFDSEREQLTSYDVYTIEKFTGEVVTHQSQFTLQLYTASEVVKMLTLQGFDRVGCYGLDGSDFSETTSQAMLMVARRR